MQMFHRGGRGTDRTGGNYSNDSGFNHGPANSDGVEVNNYFCHKRIIFVDLEFNYR